jgi:glycosyltransferase involved in cell wall biosynthesis
MPGSPLDVRLESPLPPSLPAGTATALFCSGTACWGGGPVRAVELGLEGDLHPADAVAMPRFEQPCRRSGFWGVVPVRAPSASGATAVLRARVTLADGSRRDARLGEIEIVERRATRDAAAGDVSEALIAVCLATFNADPRLFEAQIDSLRAQSDSHWICVISDDCSEDAAWSRVEALTTGDPRFVLSRSEQRIGFYRNFERALTLVDADAGLIALCDQDDRWHPDKLARLRAGLGGAMLAYCDQRLVDESGRVLRETLWRGRANNHTNLASLLIANTVTGAAALMRREVVERALPFPDSPGIEFHDHWLALVALACGKLAYVDAPLYDYVQHPAAILGKVAATGAVAPAPRRPARLGSLVRRRLRMREWRAAYFLGYVPGQVRAQTLLVRCERELTPAKRRALERYGRADRSAGALAWLTLRPLRALSGRTETLGGEWELLPGVAWVWLGRWLARARWLPWRLTLDARFPDPPHFEHRRLRRWRSRVSA